MPMLYRSPVTRLILSMAGTFAGLMLIFGPERWRQTTSLTWLAQAQIPLRAWGVLVVVYALLLLFEATRPFAYALGTALWAVFTISLLATIPEAGPKSALAVAAFIDVTAFHAFSIRTAFAQKFARQDVGPLP